jgi:hypothetical protein
MHCLIGLLKKRKKTKVEPSGPKPKQEPTKASPSGQAETPQTLATNSAKEVSVVNTAGIGA